MGFFQPWSSVLVKVLKAQHEANILYIGFRGVFILFYLPFLQLLALSWLKGYSCFGQRDSQVLPALIVVLSGQDFVAE